MADNKIGLKIKRLRKALGISQMKLAESVGVSFQQIQKYENGINRVSLEKLDKISEALNVTIGCFIDKKEYKIKGQNPVTAEDTAEYIKISFDDLTDREMQLVLKFRAVKSEDIKKGVMQILMGVNERKL